MSAPKQIAALIGAFAVLGVIGRAIVADHLGPYMRSKTMAERIHHGSLIAGFLLTLVITAWSASCLVGGAQAQAHRRTPVEQISPQYDHDSIVEHGIQIQQLQSAGNTAIEENKSLRLEIKYLKDQIEEQKRDIASAKAGAYTLVSLFGFILTALSIMQHFTIKKVSKGGD